MSQPRTSEAATRVRVGQTPAQATRTAQPTRHPVPIVVTIVSPAADTSLELGPGSRTEEPTMPTVKLKATVTLQGQPATIGTVRWELRLSGEYRVRDRSADGGYRMQSYDFPAGNTETAPGEEKEFRLAPALVCGGNLSVRASYTGGPEVGGASVTKTVSGCKVVGGELPRAEVAAYIAERAGDLAWLYLRLFYVETRANPYQQFRRGGPWYGPPAGVGIVQRDPEADEWRWPANRTAETNNFFPRIYWNWRRNVEEGISYFTSEKLPLGRSDIANLRRRHPNLPEPADGVIYRAGIRRYNGGVEYQASEDGRHYVAPPRAGNDYADLVVNADVAEAQPYPVPPEASARIWPALPPPPPQQPAPRRR